MQSAAARVSGMKSMEILLTFYSTALRRMELAKLYAAITKEKYSVVLSMEGAVKLPGLQSLFADFGFFPFVVTPADLDHKSAHSCG